MCRQNSAAFQFILFVYFGTYQLNFRRSSQSSFIFFNIYFLLKIYWEVSYSLDGKELAWSMQSSSLKTTLTVAWNTLVVTHYTCMRNVFGMNRKIVKHSSVGQNGWGYKSLSIRPSPLSIASQSLHGNCQDTLSWGQVTSTLSRNQSAFSTPASMLSCPMLYKIGEHILESCK